MAQPSRRHQSREQWLRRIDRAAAGMNPFLTVLAIGLVILNATCLVLTAPRLPITRLAPQAESCATGARLPLRPAD